ncbi:MAG TPA: hypothetical protein VFQ32_07390 [Ktedonobacterales bacterium]|nr:hypothetical protein [Ktedonobacterales bacterium]
MFPRRDQPDAPRRRSPFTPYTGLLTLLWLLLVVYIITHPDPIGDIILIVVGVFILAPTLFLWALIVRGQRRQAGENPDGEYETPAGSNGRYVAGENGAHAERQNEPDEVSGEIPEQTPEDGGENP